MCSLSVKKMMLAGIALCALPTCSVAQTIIGHRGAFHDTDDAQVLAENSEAAVAQAKKLGVPGVELDLRMSSDGIPIVTHDQTSNRSISADNLNGAMNAVDTYLGEQRTPDPINISSKPASFWTGQSFKAYTNLGHLLTANQQHPDTIDQMVHYISVNSGAFFDSYDFKIIFDIQDPAILSYAGKLLESYPAGFRSHFYLKFFASKALYGAFHGKPYKYTGSGTCYQYAVDNHLQLVNIIPQINDGELTADENEDDDAGIKAFGTILKPADYLQCWADALQQHSDAPTMPIVSASVPFDNDQAATGASDALTWARKNGRKTMTIVPNPDTSVKYPKCIYLSFMATPPYARPFNTTAQSAKGLFAIGENPDYLIADIMDHPGGGIYYTAAENAYANSMCR